MHWGYGMGGWMILWTLVGMVIVGAFVWAIVRAGGSGGAAPRPETPEDILRARYARGELTREQFEQMREDLRR
ncbi:MAG: SHOCT domain-containing protein [Acidobacteria bacterium]|nr:SHOCT domain-containing protein [Acidobacteriota bacterium]